MAKLIILVALLLIIVSLASALRSMMRGDAPGKMARALTWRIGLSVALFVMIVVFAKLGWVTPHGINPA